MSMSQGVYTPDLTWKLPPIPEWKLYFTLEESNYYIASYTAPCRLHRALQRLILGIRWERIEEKP